jgi:histone H3/H4
LGENTVGKEIANLVHLLPTVGFLNGLRNKKRRCKIMAKKEEVKIPSATIVRLFKSAGAERVGGDVPEAVNKIVLAIAKSAVASAKAAGRKTVSADDLRLVVVSG